MIATQNPIEYEGTFPLPEAQLDRFMLKLSIGYPSLDEEKQIIHSRQERQKDAFELSPVHRRGDFLAMRQAVRVGLRRP